MGTVTYYSAGSGCLAVGPKNSSVVRAQVIAALGGGIVSEFGSDYRGSCELEKVPLTGTQMRPRGSAAPPRNAFRWGRASARPRSCRPAQGFSKTRTGDRIQAHSSADLGGLSASALEYVQRRGAQKELWANWGVLCYNTGCDGERRNQRCDGTDQTGCTT
jgi:hypothetical protein